MTVKKSDLVVPIGGIMLIALLIRLAVTSVSPALTDIQHGLGISAGVAGLTITIPLICNGVLGLLTPLIMRWLSPVAALFFIVVLVTVGVGVRIIPATSLLLASVSMVGVGMAISNIVFPALIRMQQPFHLNQYMGLYTVMVNLGSASGSLATGIFMGAIGMPWQLALGVWFPVLAGVLLWTIWVVRAQIKARAKAQVQVQVQLQALSLVSDGGDVGFGPAAGGEDAGGLVGADAGQATSKVAGDTGGGDTSKAGNGAGKAQAKGVYSQLLREKDTYLIILYGTMSFLFSHVILTWLPAQMQATGTSISQSSLWVSVFLGIAIPAGFIAPTLLDKAIGKTVIISSYVLCIPFLVFTHLGGWFAIGTSVFGGIAQGFSYSLVLTMVARTPDLNRVMPLSALTQGCGYLLAGIAPTAFGFMSSALGSWLIPNLLLALCILVMLVLHLAVAFHPAREKQIDYQKLLGMDRDKSGPTRLRPDNLRTRMEVPMHPFV